MDHASTQSVVLAGTKIVFKSPRHDPSPYGETPQIRMRKSYSLNAARPLNWNEQPSQSWLHTELFFRSWSFCGPWFTGYMGTVSCYFDVIQLAEPNPRVSFIYPGALETAALAFLTANYGYSVLYKETQEMHYVGPVNWSTREQIDVPSVQVATE
ncbi:hypothetical protein, partial [Thalassolituus sp.]|uniref:hypothetical protein n=1 Tax=Thalassolituus sp. TaxID=2030822 RepID=UPI003514B5BC